MEPKDYPERILLAVTGLSPQVVTETLFVLAVRNTPPFTPTEVHLLTTSEGQSRAELTLLEDGQGQFARLCREYGLEGIRFGPEQIHVIADASGRQLNDIREPADNTAAADTITDTVRRLTARPDSALHVSIAGGRKTMGFYLGYALSLFGRPQDRLSHVLVSEPFESNPQFYFPPVEPEVLFTRDNKPVSTRDARLTLAEVPFVRLRHGLPEDLLSGDADFSTTVRAAQRGIDPPRLCVDLDGRQVVCGGKPVPMQPQLLAWLAWMAGRRVADLPHGGHVHWTEADPSEFLRIYRSLVGEMSHDYEKASEVLRDGFSKDYFLEKVSRVNAVLRAAHPPNADAYRIRRSGRRPLSRHGLTLDPAAISFGAPAAGPDAG